MSLKTLLMPMITQHRFARSTLLAQRAKAEKARLASGRPHQVYYFHQVDDPYSHLLAQALPRFLARYQVELKPYVVSPPPDSAAFSKNLSRASSVKTGNPCKNLSMSESNSFAEA